MDIVIRFENPVVISLIKSRERLNDYSAISLTAGNFTANLNNFNLLPAELHGNRGLRRKYNEFINKVNTSREVGIKNEYAPPIYFFVPKTRGNENIDDIIRDLFNGVNEVGVKDLLMTHWMYLNSSFPELEFQALINFIKNNNISLDELHIKIDKIYINQLFNILNSNLK
jgi:hypothetical protein